MNFDQSQPKSDKVKTLINNANIASAAQIANQLSSAVVNLAAKQLSAVSNSDISPLADFLSLEPLAGPFKNLKKRIVYLNLVLQTLSWQPLKRLAAMEAYDASSRAHEGQERKSNEGEEPPRLDINDPASVRVPPTAHIRRHVARLGLKLQSYARAALLDIFCNDQINGGSDSTGPSGGVVNNYNMCPRYDDMIFLINSHLPHWKCPNETYPQGSFSKDIHVATSAVVEDGSKSLNDGTCSCGSIDSTSYSTPLPCVGPCSGHHHQASSESKPEWQHAV
ncbi:hypothetical protein KIW84_032002 [Lathyrus oleraceus]|uniref:Uncharacterized protein n=1 Tax=Pisum sativum TaxID=3888 RepID=A0A9D5B143_PEA|nr:hypothetical protein KIW84_032002 [Pisum sativum]